MKTVPERLATLEERDRHIVNKLDEVSKRVDEIYTLIQRGKGAKWMVVVLVSLISWAIGAAGHKWLPF